MSYILDALKKSDRERKRGDVPNLQTIHIPMNTEQQMPWGLYGFISILLLVLAFVFGLLISDKEPNVVQIVEKKSSIKNNVVDRPVVAKLADGEVEIDNRPVSEPKADFQPDMEENTVLGNSQQKTSQVKVAISEDKPRQVQKASIQSIQSDTSYQDINDIPYLHEMQDYQQQSVPDMNFAGHVYSTKATSRSVIINGAVMSEGDTVVQGINVVEITPGGVVFSLHNELFRMDILQDWSFE